MRSHFTKRPKTLNPTCACYLWVSGQNSFQAARISILQNCLASKLAKQTSSHVAGVVLSPCVSLNPCTNNPPRGCKSRIYPIKPNGPYILQKLVKKVRDIKASLTTPRGVSIPKPKLDGFSATPTPDTHKKHAHVGFWVLGPLVWALKSKPILYPLYTLKTHGLIFQNPIKKMRGNVI